MALLLVLQQTHFPTIHNEMEMFRGAFHKNVHFVTFAHTVRFVIGTAHNANIKISNWEFNDQNAFYD